MSAPMTIRSTGRTILRTATAYGLPLVPTLRAE
jgi:hypothetical protein